MSDLYDVEEADREAAERLRVHEWAAEHQNPLTAALQRAESAEARADLAEARLARAERSVDQVRDGPMSAQRLRDAAKVLHERAGRAAEAAPGPWGVAMGSSVLRSPRRTDDGHVEHFGVVADVDGFQFEDDFPDDSEERAADVARLIATMSPPLALALADWLDAAARDFLVYLGSRRAVGDIRPEVPAGTQRAFAVADVLAQIEETRP